MSGPRVVNRVEWRVSLRGAPRGSFYFTEDLDKKMSAADVKAWLIAHEPAFRGASPREIAARRYAVRTDVVARDNPMPGGLHAFLNLVFGAAAVGGIALLVVKMNEKPPPANPQYNPPDPTIAI